MLKKFSLIIITALCCFLFSFGADCGFCAQQSSALKKVRVGYIPVGDCLQLYVAEDQGFFKAEGLDVEMVPFKGGSLIAVAVEAGELDAGWSNTASLVIAKDRGFDFKIISPGAFEVEGTHRVHSLLVRNDSAINSFADLKGKVVAINTLGNINEIALTALAAENGIDIKDITLVEVPFPNMGPALASGAVSAALTLEPFVSIAQSKGSARLLEPAALKSFGKRFLIAVWFAREEWNIENSATVEAFRTAVLKASKFIEENPEKARQALTRHTKLTSELAYAIKIPYFAQKINDSDIQGIIDLAARFGFIKKRFSASTFLSN